MLENDPLQAAAAIKDMGYNYRTQFKVAIRAAQSTIPACEDLLKLMDNQTAPKPQPPKPESITATAQKMLLGLKLPKISQTWCHTPGNCFAVAWKRISLSLSNFPAWKFEAYLTALSVILDNAQSQATEA